jgi:hypothetical protein
MKVSKLVNNNKSWTAVSSLAQTGILVNGNIQNKNKYNFGLEEFINCEILRKHKLGYLDSFRSFPRLGYYERIELINFSNGIVYHVGRLDKVKRIKCTEIPLIKGLLLKDNWLKKVEADFHKIQDLRPIENHNEYMQCWNSEDIVAPTNEGFVLNIRYDTLTFFEHPINLSAQEASVNNQWKRLIHLYEVPQNLEYLFIS